ncbi:hypothetical protein MJO28_008433, partial [Puccinia striiformis f. sp. tritici]
IRLGTVSRIALVSGPRNLSLSLKLSDQFDFSKEEKCSYSAPSCHHRRWVVLPAQLASAPTWSTHDQQLNQPIAILFVIRTAKSDSLPNYHHSEKYTRCYQPQKKLNRSVGPSAWRVLLPKSEPIIKYVVDLNNRYVVLISGEKKIHVRLILLSDADRWRTRLQSDHYHQSMFPPFWLCQSYCLNSSIPSIQTQRSLISIYIFCWLQYDRNILKVLTQNPADQINLLRSKEDSKSTYITQVQSLLSTTGTAHTHCSG